MQDTKTTTKYLMEENTARYRRRWSPDPLQDNDSLTKIYNLVQPGSTVLDVGCSIGQLGAVLVKAKRCEVIGVDIDRRSIEEAQKVLTNAYEVDILKTPIETICGKKLFRYIIFADVLEHLVDPVGALKAAQAALAPEGEILISIPNITHASVRLSLLQGKFEYTDEGLLDRTHTFFYTRKSFFELLKRADLELLMLDRTYLGATDGDISVSIGGIVTPEILSAVEREDEATTYQFIARVAPPGPKHLPKMPVDLGADNPKAENMKPTKIEDTVMSLSHSRKTSAIGTVTAEALEVQLANLQGDVLRRLEDQRAYIQALEHHIANLKIQVNGVLSLLPIRLWRRFRRIR